MIFTSETMVQRNRIKPAKKGVIPKTRKRKLSSVNGQVALKQRA
jgi:hypothetical protein